MHVARCCGRFRYFISLDAERRRAVFFLAEARLGLVEQRQQVLVLGLKDDVVALHVAELLLQLFGASRQQGLDLAAHLRLVLALGCGSLELFDGGLLLDDDPVRTL